MTPTRLAAICALCALSGPAGALDLNLPGKAQLVRELDRAADTYFLPLAPLTDGQVPARELEGRVVRQAWRITGEDMSTLGLLSAIRGQMQDQGYELLLDCTGEECGGFDFRFGIDVLPAPDMFVDLFDFRFLSAQNDAAEGAQFVSALVSRAGQVGYIQLVLAGVDDGFDAPEPSPIPQSTPEAETPAEGSASDPAPDGSEGDIAAALTTQGHVILSDLVFATGSSTLEDGPYRSLSQLAAFLKDDPARRVVLVGHTDAVGTLENNVRLSRARAASVSQRLIQTHSVPREQVAAEGMGYLSPVASNASEEGRHANRRVEAVLLNTR